MVTGSPQRARLLRAAAAKTLTDFYGTVSAIIHLLMSSVNT